MCWLWNLPWGSRRKWNPNNCMREWNDARISWMKIRYLCQWSSLQWVLGNITEADLLRLVIQTILDMWRNCPSRESSALVGRHRTNEAEGMHFLSQRDVEVAVLVLTALIISIIAKWWLKHGPETVWKILLNEITAEKTTGLWFGNMSSCLGKWSNCIWRRDTYLFETLVTERVLNEVQGEEGSFSAEVNGDP